MKLAERAQAALKEMEDIIIEYLKARPDGAINNEIARELSLQSDSGGNQQNYLTYSILGGLMKQGRVIREETGRRRAYKLPDA